MGYLKALGVLRLVYEQVDSNSRGRWSDGVFVLETELDREGLVHFFLEGYRPTPLIAPWAGGSGFFGSDNRTAVDAIVESESPRLSGFAALVRQVRELLVRFRIKNKPSAEAKEELLRCYRRELPDEFVGWMDTAVVVQSAGQSFPPLLGTGGNDGRLDFTQNYMQRLVALGFAEGRLVAEAEGLLRQTLFAEPARGLVSAAVGQFDPGRAGGPNATTGMEGGALVNPWDFVLMLEGSLPLAGAAARRLGVTQRDRAAFPFTVGASAVGYGSGAEGEQGGSRGEIWLPLWEMPASLGEIMHVFAEGRAETCDRQSRDGVDFARAVAGLGVDRGIAAFVRYGFLKRSGKAFVAAPMGTIPVRMRWAIDLLREIDPWLESLKRATSSDDVPARFRSARRRIEAAIFDYCRGASGGGDASLFQSVLAALGAAERELALGDFAPEKRRVRWPLSGISAAWITACDDGSPEFRLARSLAFFRGREGKWGSIRGSLEPVDQNRGAWRWGQRGGHVVWAGQDLVRNLGVVLTRRVMDRGQAGEGPLPGESLFPASLADIAAFLDRASDDEKLEDLLWGLMLVNPRDVGWPRPGGGGYFVLPRAYALLKLAILPGRLEWERHNSDVRLQFNRPKQDEEPPGIAVKPEPAMLSKLSAGDLRGACEIAARRLRVSGFVPIASHLPEGHRRSIDWTACGVGPARLLAALLFPISDRAVNDLAALVLRRPADQSLF
jgi:CRISPR-associated protein Csx17